MFRPHSITLRDKLPAPPKIIPKKRPKVAKVSKVMNSFATVIVLFLTIKIQKSNRPMKMFNSIKKEPRDLLEARLQQQSLMLGQVCKILYMYLTNV